MGPQSVIAPLNHVLSLSPCFASCCLQSLGTLSPYSQVMPPGGSVTCCCHRVSLCQGTTGALLNISLPKVGEVGGPVQEGPLGPGESSMQVLPGRVDPGSSFCPMVGSTSNQEQAWGKGMVCRQGGKSLWPDTVAWSQTLGVTACSLSAGGRASGEPLQLQRTHRLPGTSHHRASTLQGLGSPVHGTPAHRAAEALTHLVLHPASSNPTSLHTFPHLQDIYESFDTRQRRASSPGYIDSPTYSRQGMSPTIPRSPHHFYRSGEDFSCNPRLG